MSVSSSVRLAVVGTIVAFSSPVWAHVSLTGPGYAKQSQVIPFNIGHGCDGADSVSLEVTIPEEVTTVRAVPTVWGDAAVTYDDAGLPRSVKWTKQNARTKDDQYYQFAIRIAVPDLPFTTLYFPAKQTCRDADGKESVVEWAKRPEEISEAAGESAGNEPAPGLLILPVRYPGWNKITVAKEVTDLTIFKDAQIVWAGDAAYSANPTTLEQIKAEDGVTELTKIDANAEIWVKY